jgi:DNA modification methylase
MSNRKGRAPRDVWRIAHAGFRGPHWAVFPVELARRCLVAGCPPGGLALDPFVGAGTTCVAARRTGRRSIGIDLDPAAIATARRRLAAESARKTRSPRRRRRDSEHADATAGPLPGQLPLPFPDPGDGGRQPPARREVAP